MSSISTLSPASTYPDIFQVANAGQGLNTTPSQVQDGLGNPTSMTISTNYINFDRSVSEFQLDSVPLTASAATLNNLSDVANANYLLVSPNAQLSNGLALGAGPGLTLVAAAGRYTIQPTDELLGIVGLGIQPPGYVVSTGGGNFASRTLLSDATINILNANGVADNSYLSVISDTCLQRVNCEVDGFFQSQKPQLNFIPGVGMGITVVDNPGQNRADITISSAITTGLEFKGAVYAATTSTDILNATYNNGAAGVGATLTENVNGALVVDSVNPPINSLVLVNSQAAQLQNGIYTVTATGGGGAPYILTRAANYNQPVQINPGDFFISTHGTQFAGFGWVEVDTVVTVGVSSILFNSFPIAPSGTVTNVSGTVNQINVANGTTTPVISISPTYVGQNSITTLGVVTTGTVTVPAGGTGVNTLTPYAVLAGGTTNTGAIQNVGVGLAGQILTSNGPGALASWQAAPGVALNVNQVGHGFVVGNVLICTGSDTFAKAQANADATSSVVGIVVAVIDANNFTLQFNGLIDVLVGLTAGQVYFLDPVTAGGYTTVRPVTNGQVAKPIFIAITATEAIWVNQLGQLVTG